MVVYSLSAVVGATACPVEEAKVRAPRALWGLAATNQDWSEAREAAQQPSRADYHVFGPGR